MFKFEKLHVWNKAADFSIEIFKIADIIPQKYQFSFGEQLKRATLSITNNIAEGAGRKTKKESNDFFNIAKGSTYEVINILIILHKNKIISLENSLKKRLYSNADEICKMLAGLVKSSSWTLYLKSYIQKGKYYVQP